MDNSMQELGNMYETMLTESTDKIKAGNGFEGSEKAKQFSSDSGSPDGVKKPVEGTKGPDVEAGKGKPLAKKACKANESANTKTKSLPSFESLFQRTVKEEEDINDEIVPADDVESTDFSEEDGDFEEDTDVDEEVDVASELRLLADRLSEIASKLTGSDETDMDVGDETIEPEPEMDGEVSEDESLGAAEPIVKKESFSAKLKNLSEAIKSEPTPKLMKKTSFSPKMKQNPKNNISTTGAGKAPIPSNSKDKTGKLSNAPKTQFGPKMCQNVKGSGPTVKGGQAKLA